MNLGDRSSPALPVRCSPMGRARHSLGARCHRYREVALTRDSAISGRKDGRAQLFLIAIDAPGGTLVTHVPAGQSVLTIHDRSAFLDFHLFGPGVNRRKTVTGIGTVKWAVTLRPGLYRYQCDAHATLVNGALRVT